MDNVTYFLSTLHGEARDADRWFSICEFHTPAYTFCQTIEDAAAHCAAIEAGGKDVYVSMAQMNEPPSAGRGKAEDVAAITCLWLDIDLAGDAHKNKSLLPDLDAAMRFLDELGPPPTMVVATGNGIHAYWMFNEPMVLDTDKEHTQAAALARRWNQTARALAQNKGRDLDQVGDLSRVMRVAGTRNTKGGKTSSIIRRGGPIYEPDDLQRYMMEEEFLPETVTGKRQTQVCAVTAFTVRSDTGVPQKVTDLIGADGAFKRLWDKERNDLKDQSGSAYDMALANEGVYRRWSDQEIADAIAAWRRKHNEKPEKAFRRDYISQTIGKARRDYRCESAVDRLDEIAVKIEPAVDDERESILEDLSDAFGRNVTNWEKTDGDEPQYAITFEPDVVIHIGGADSVVNFQKFKTAVFAQQVVVNTSLRKRWDAICRCLCRIVKVVEDPEGTLEGRIASWLNSYLLKHHPWQGGERGNAIALAVPFIHADSLWVHADSLRKHVVSDMRIPLTAPALRKDLKAFGFAATKAQQAGRCAQKRYWRVPLAVIEDVWKPTEDHK